MTTYGIIAEFNPFHNGHEYLIKECRNNGATHIVAVMSGNFVQRGESAIMSKWARTKVALMSGVDLVVELPVNYAVSSAQRFARGAVSILDSLGCIDYLSFGSECGDIELLKSAADVIISDDFNQKIKENLDKRVNYPTALHKTLTDLAEKDVANVLNGSNNTLAIEYLIAINQLDAKLKPFTVSRKGAEHDSVESIDGFMSASKIRGDIKSGNLDFFKYVPKATAEVFNEEVFLKKAPVLYENFEMAILAKLRMLSLDDIKKAPDISEGLENRIFDAIKKCTTLDELYSTIKSKRYTHARIRRIILSLFLDIQAEDFNKLPPYIRVLGFNEKGQEILKAAKNTAKLPVIMKPTTIFDLDDYAKSTFSLECKATDIYTLAMPKPLHCGIEMTENIVIL